jgi:exopolysaccharide biosynthesis polyprenyl glycosylphosphotransferase
MDAHFRRTLFLRLFQLWEGFTLIAAFSLAFVFSISSGDGSELFILFSWPQALFIFGMAILWHWILSSLKLYESKRFAVRSEEYWDVIKATTLSTAFLAGGGTVFQLDHITPVFMLTFWLFSTLATLVTRISLRYVLRKVRQRGRNLRFILIIGSGQRGRALATQITEQPWLGYRLLGFIDDVDFNEERKLESNLLGSFACLPQILSKNVVDEVFICLPVKSLYEKIQQVINQCAEQGVVVRLVADFFYVRQARLKIDHLDQTPILSLQTGPEGDRRFIVKRMMDISIASLLLLLLSPLFLVIVCMVKASSSGPVFFRQERVGYNKRRFTLLKFRTMVQEAEDLLPELVSANEVSGPVFKIKNDPRLTKVGKFLRRTSVDELPQLFNVLKGDMSLVGPRPLPVRDVEGFRQDWQRRRFSIQPGITCLWQLAGRSNVPFERWMELDLEYIDNWSLKLDVMILLRTIPAVIKGSGAY